MTSYSIRPNSPAAWLVCARPKTWGVSIAPVIVGLAFALAQQGCLNVPLALATLLLAILMQSISNMENDAGYTKRKAERSNRKGLPRATSLGWLSVSSVEKGIKVLGAVVFLDTLYLIYHGGWGFALVSLCSIICAYCYMGGPKPLAYTPFSEAMVFLFFGLVAVCGTFYLQTHTLSLIVVLASASLGLIASAVLAVNNYRDAEHDASIGRKTLAVVFGRPVMAQIYRAMLLLPHALCLLIMLVDWHFLPLGFLLIPQGMKLATLLPQKEGLELNAVLFDTVTLELQFALLITLSALVAYGLS